MTTGSGSSCPSGEPMHSRCAPRIHASRAVDASRRRRRMIRTRGSMRWRTAALVESSEDPIIGLTLDGVITDWNPAAERLYGYSAGRRSARRSPCSCRRSGAADRATCWRRCARVRPSARSTRSAWPRTAAGSTSRSRCRRSGTRRARSSAPPRSRATSACDRGRGAAAPERGAACRSPGAGGAGKLGVGRRLGRNHAGHRSSTASSGATPTGLPPPRGLLRGAFTLPIARGPRRRSRTRSRTGRRSL